MNIHLPRGEDVPNPIAISVVFFLFFMLFYTFHGASAHLWGVDGYYHVKAGKITVEQGPIQDFPWMTLGLWADHFADKEFLFHLYLGLFTFLEGIPFFHMGRGTPQISPLSLLQTGELASSLMVAAIFAVFFYILRLRKVPFPLAWTFLLAFSNYQFIYRLLLIRPHIMSLLLLLIGVHLFLENRHKSLFALGVVFSLSYHAAYVLLATGMVYQGLRFIEREDIQWKALFATGGGLVLGYLVHPGFPENMYLFYLQNLTVLSNSVSETVQLGAEMGPTTTKVFLYDSWLVIAIWGAVFYLALKERVETQMDTRYMFLMGVAFCLFTCLLVRFLLYWSLFSVLFFALFFRDYLQDRSLSLPPKKVWQNTLAVGLFLFAVTLLGFHYTKTPFSLSHLILWLFLLALFVGAFFWLAPRPSHRTPLIKLTPVVLLLLAGVWVFRPTLTFLGMYHHFRHVPGSKEAPNKYSAVGDFIKSQIPEGARIFCSWTIFPMLFYHSHHHRYTFGLDPTFFYDYPPGRYRVVDGEKLDLWKIHERLTLGRDPRPHHTLKRIFGMDYVLIGLSPLSGQLEKHPKFKVVFEDREAIVFQILPH